MIRRLLASALALAILAGPAFGQTSVIIRKADNSAAVDPATAANQATEAASLASMDGKLTSQATAANQASQLTQETALNTVLGLQADVAWTGSGSGTVVALQKYIAAKIEGTRALLAGTLTVQFASPQAVTQSGTWNIGAITGAVTLPTGASTATGQATANASLSSIDNKTPNLAGASGVTPVTGVLVSSTKTAAFTPLGGRTFYLELSGTGSAVVEVQYLLNDGSTYAAEVVATDGGSPTVLNSISYAGGTRNGVRIPLEVAQSGMSVKASPGTVTGTVNFAFVQ